MKMRRTTIGMVNCWRSSELFDNLFILALFLLLLLLVGFFLGFFGSLCFSFSFLFFFLDVSAERVVSVFALGMLILRVKNIDHEICKSVSSQRNLSPSCFEGHVRVFFAHLICVFEMFIGNIFGSYKGLFAPLFRVDLFGLLRNCISVFIDQTLSVGMHFMKGMLV